MPFKSLNSLVEEAKTLQEYTTKQDFSDEQYGYIPLTDETGQLDKDLAKMLFTDLSDTIDTLESSDDNKMLTVASDGSIELSEVESYSSDWVKFANGFIMMWGVDNTTSSGDGSHSVTFPTAFPNACFCVYLTGKLSSSSSSSDWVAQIVSYTTTGFTWYFQDCGSNTNDSGISYIAIGR